MGNPMSLFYSEQWRKGNVSSSEEKKVLLKNILRQIGNIPEECQSVNILMIGKLSSGKSSLTNTLKTAMKDDVDKCVDTSAPVHGPNVERGTHQLHKVNLHAIDRKIVRLFDCRGLQQQDYDRTAFVSDLEKVIMGHIVENYKFKIETNEGIAENDPKFRIDPPFYQRMHCVLFVMKATDVTRGDTISDVPLKRIKKFVEDRNIPLRIVLTGMDNPISFEKSHIDYIYTSKAAKKMVEDARKKFDISDAHILPIVNYLPDESERKPTKDFLALQALDNILQQALSFIGDNVK